MTPLLALENINSFYGKAQALFDVSLTIMAGEVVALLGRNGMGKTTTVASIMGLVQPESGRVMVAGQNLTSAPPFRLAQAGIGLVPEGRQIFPSLSVRENLIATAAARQGPARWTLKTVTDLFPRLAERADHRGNELSGGEQQMLAIGRALMTNPRLLILDEATEGLAPLIRADIWACLAALKREGQALLVIDKSVAALVKLADRHVILEKGRVAWHGSNIELATDVTLRERYLQV